MTINADYCLSRTDNGPSLQIHLRRSERAKRTRIVVTCDKIEVVAPLTVSERSIKTFVTAQQEWIRTAMQRVLERSQSARSLAPTKYTHGANVPYQGGSIPLVIQPSSGRRVIVQLSSDLQFVVRAPACVSENSSDLIRLALEKYMKQQARQQASWLIEKHTAKHHLIPRGLRIKTLKSRWGSCGPHNDINLNWLLMLAPPVIFEYVVIHELCHIKHKNHSKEFWHLVADHMPDYLQHRQWLKQHGSSLMQGL